MAERSVNVSSSGGSLSLSVSVIGLVRAVPQVFLYDTSDKNPVEVSGQQQVGNPDYSFALGDPENLDKRVVTWLITAAPAGSDTPHCTMIGTFAQNGRPCSPSPFAAPPADISDVTVLALSARISVNP